MVTVSNNTINYVNTPALKGAATAPTAVKPEKAEKQKIRIYKKDTLLENSLSEKMRVNWEKTKAIPLRHYPRGLGGAQDFTFFEYLQTAKLPYYVGGPILAALFYAGVNKDNFQAAKSAKGVAKHMALGVGLYYLGAAIAKSIVNTTVRATRGIDLNHPYVKAVPGSTTNQTGVFPKDIEYHKAFESADFTRWDLLYNEEGKTPDEVNARYKKIGKRYGIKEDTNDIDSTVKPLIKKTIVMARAWQYALTAFYVALGIGMANQPAWAKESMAGFKRTIKDGVFGKGLPMKEKLHNAKIAGYDYILKPFGKSFKEFWKGHSKASSIAGKATILAAGLATLSAVSLLIGKTSAKSHEIVNKDNTNEGRK